MYRFILPVFLAAALLTGSFTRCPKRNATIVRDCSGTYLRMKDADYLVCNKAMLADFAAGTAVKVRYKSIEKCPPTDEMVCMLYHEHKGVVEVTKVE